MLPKEQQRIYHQHTASLYCIDSKKFDICINCFCRRFFDTWGVWDPTWTGIPKRYVINKLLRGQWLWKTTKPQRDHGAQASLISYTKNQRRARGEAEIIFTMIRLFEWPYIGFVFIICVLLSKLAYPYIGCLVFFEKSPNRRVTYGIFGQAEIAWM